MTKPRGDRVLVAIDGSKRSLQTVAYITQAPFFRRMEIHLFHIFCSVPDSYWDMEREPSSMKASAHVRAWESQKHKEIEDHLIQCRDILLGADFNPEHIKVTIQKRKQGIARDIINESKNGYRAVVLRRRGMTKLPGLIMGSVAYKLLDHIHSVPLILAGKKPANNRILLAMDGSANAMRALEFVSRMLAGQDYEVTLVNVLRKVSAHHDEDTEKDHAKKLPKEVGLSIQHILYDASAQLQAAGFDEKNVQIETITHAFSRAGAIVDLAKLLNISTIVMGRKGISRVQEFMMGRVSNKVLHTGRDFHIWMVN